MTINMTDLRQIFRERQYKLTTQRQNILQAFVDHPEQHLSAEDVHGIVRRSAPETGLATVYRTLELLSDLDILQKLDFGDGRHRYEINETSTPHHHHHLICLYCGKVREFEDDLLETLETAVARKSKFNIVDHQLKFYGYCQECQAKRES
jgi:Fur family ferric uptake transcriptional regulator